MKHLSILSLAILLSACKPNVTSFHGEWISDEHGEKCIIGSAGKDRLIITIKGKSVVFARHGDDKSTFSGADPDTKESLVLFIASEDQVTLRPANSIETSKMITLSRKN